MINSIVSYVLGHSNNNKLVFDTFDLAIERNPNASPLFHSDRGLQYRSKEYKNMLDDNKIISSISKGNILMMTQV